MRASFSSDGIVLLDVERGLVFAANAVGARIWQLLADSQDSDVAAARIAAEYGIEPDVAGRDVRAFVSSLVTRGLLVLGEDAA